MRRSQHVTKISRAKIVQSSKQPLRVQKKNQTSPTRRLRQKMDSSHSQKEFGIRKLDRIIDHCRIWAKSVHSIIGVGGLYVFGSIVYRSGVQFDPQNSDLDLVALIPSELVSASQKTEWLIKLQKLKQDLEVSLIPLLGRSNAAKPIASVVPFTRFELDRDIHKSGARNFFRQNIFTDLLRNNVQTRLLKRAPFRVNELARQVLQFAQGTRNKFLAISASGSRSLVTWDDASDPMPKDLMRYAAMASRLAGASALDVQAGLDGITDYLFSLRESHESYRELYNWLSVRRGARGQVQSLSPENYVFLTEAITDLLRLKIQKRPLIPARASKRKREGRPAKSERSKATLTQINGYKLFYFRLNHKLTHKGLARATGLEAKLIRKLEKVRPRRGDFDPSLWFSPCDRYTLNLLEDALDCHGRLEANKRDDFLTQYMMFYERDRASHRMGRGNRDEPELSFETKVVVFDFDGTLTECSDNKTTWERIWVTLGYSLDECFELHRRFQRKEFTHQEWCDITRDAFKVRGLTHEHIVSVANEMSLVKGVADTVSELRKRGIKLYILSGSIKVLIRQLLGTLSAEFEEIRANELVFDRSGILSQIQGTPYDFEGKAIFIRRLIEELRLSPADVLFVGNSCNDVFASQSGARTICVNAHHTDPDNQEQWTYAIREMVSLSQILQYVDI